MAVVRVSAGLDAGGSYAAWTRRAAAHMLDGVVAGAFSALVALGIATLAPVLGIVAGACCYALYFALGHGSGRGQTPAKRLFGIAVRSSLTGGQVGYRRAFVRFGTLVLFGLMGPVVLVNFLWPLRDQRRQAWHDKAAGTIVVQDPADR